MVHRISLGTGRRNLFDRSFAEIDQETSPSIGSSIASILSLSLLMWGCRKALRNFEQYDDVRWMKLLFFFALAGALIGWVLETLLLVYFHEPYCLNLTGFVASVGNVRSLINMLCLNSGTLFVLFMTLYHEDSQHMNMEVQVVVQNFMSRLILYSVVLVTAIMSVVAYYMLEWWIPVFVVGSLLFQLYLVFGMKAASLIGLITFFPWLYDGLRNVLFGDEDHYDRTSAVTSHHPTVVNYWVHHVAGPLVVNVLLISNYARVSWCQTKLGLAAVFRLAAQMTGWESTPLQSTAFHLLVAGMIYHAWIAAKLRIELRPGFGTEVTRALTPATYGCSRGELFGFLTSRALGLVSIAFIIVRWFMPQTFYAARSTVVYVIWSFLYFGLLFQPILQDNPFKLSDMYKNNNNNWEGRRASSQEPPKPTKLAIFTDRHPNYMPSPLEVLTIQYEEYPPSFRVFDRPINMVATGFGVITWMGQTSLRLADPRIPITKKPRLERGNDDGRRVLPFSLFSLWPWFPEQAKRWQPVPEVVLEAYRDGRLLGHLCQFGIGNTFLRLAQETDQYPFFRLVVDEINDEDDDDDARLFGLVVDFRHLELYETKDDYYSYGGVAFLRALDLPDKSTGRIAKRLDVVWVMEPGSHERVYKNTFDGSYYRISHRLVSSLYFEVIAGKHLMELHMKYELLEAALHNVFDFGENVLFRKSSRLVWHPIRLILYPHLFCNTIATDLLVVHLVQHLAVFSQIFATKYKALLDYLTDTSTNFVYAADEDWEYRKKVATYFRSNNDRNDDDGVKSDVVNTSMGCAIGANYGHDKDKRSIIFHSQYDWEEAYLKIWNRYAESMVDAIYSSDDEVSNDASLHRLHHTLTKLFSRSPSGLPLRYQSFETKAGLARFLSDTIHHLVVRHYVYGTGIVHQGGAALDARINVPQFPKDMGPPAVDEYRAYAFILMATAYPYFCKLLQDPGHRQKHTTRDLHEIFDDVGGAGAYNYFVQSSASSSSSSLGTTDPTELQQLMLPLNLRMKAIFHSLQADLRELNTEWTYTGGGDRSRADPMYMYGIPLPEDLLTGPCS